MNEESKTILKIIGIEFNEIDDLNGLSILRDQLLSDNKYEEVKKLLPELKKIYSSSLMTSLQKNADKSQKWPLLNLVRQILSTHNYKMEPIRKSDGYTLEGVKKYKRYFLIKKKSNTNSVNLIKKIDLDLYDDNEDINEIINETLVEEQNVI
jgi:hypothetical protein